MAICWFLWKARYAARFKGDLFQANGVILQIESFLTLLRLAGKLRTPHFMGDIDCDLMRYVKHVSRSICYYTAVWKKPSFGTFKLNT